MTKFQRQLHEIQNSNNISHSNLKRLIDVTDHLFNALEEIIHNNQGCCAACKGQAINCNYSIAVSTLEKIDKNYTLSEG